MSLRHQCVPLLWKLTQYQKNSARTKISPELQSLIKCDQFAYKEGASAANALIMCNRKWLNWLDNNADHFR